MFAVPWENDKFVAAISSPKQINGGVSSREFDGLPALSERHLTMQWGDAAVCNALSNKKRQDTRKQVLSVVIPNSRVPTVGLQFKEDRQSPTGFSFGGRLCRCLVMEAIFGQCC